MKSNIENGVLTIYLEGHLNSANADEVESKIKAIVSKKGFKSIKLDFDNLNYISSAGLRIILRLKQQIKDTSLINVSDAVYDVFSMVGFQNIIDIQRKG